MFMVLCVGASPLGAIYNTNFFRGHDVGFLPLFEPENRKFTAGATLEYGGTTEKSYNTEGNQGPLFEAYSKQQSAQAMLSDPVVRFPATEDPEQWFMNTVQQTYNDEWGTFNVTGKFQEANVTFWGRGALPLMDEAVGVFSLAAYLPIKALHIRDVLWTDMSNIYGLGAEERINGFSSRLQDFVTNVGDNLSLGDWSKIGQGDLSVLLEWHNEFRRELDIIRHVRIDAAVGVVVPTGRMLSSDVDQILSVPMGNGGAWGLPARAGIEICFHPKVSAGVSVDMLALTDITKKRRLKTHMNQTDYLLLTARRVRLQHARTWRFNLFARIKTPLEGLSASVSYHFAKRGDDVLIPDENVISGSIINSQEALKECSSHDLVFKFNFSRDDQDAFTAPGISAFLKIPVGGRRTIKNITVGGEFMFAF
jgi:hypothetical protein